MYNIGLVVVACSSRQDIFWKSYLKHDAGLKHDMIVVHKDYKHRFTHAECQNIIYEHKIDAEVPHKAFGAYRKFGLKYSGDYDCLAFISDDVSIRCNGWLLGAMDTLHAHPRVGCVATQIFNGDHGQYPHPSHIRSPIWFAKSTALNNINWEFNDDHDGEMKIADQFANAGYLVVQAGDKVNIAYDAFEQDHISVLMEEHFSKRYTDKYDRELDLERRLICEDISGMDITSPYGHIGTRNIVRDLQPYNRLLYDHSVMLAQSLNVAETHPFNTFLLK